MQGLHRLEDHAGNPLEDPDETGHEPYKLRLALGPLLLLALDVLQQVPGERLRPLKTQAAFPV